MSTFEFEVLHALDSAVTASNIREHLERRGVSASIGGVFVALDRLQHKGFAVRSRGQLIPKFGRTIAGKRFLDNMPAKR